MDVLFYVGAPEEALLRYIEVDVDRGVSKSAVDIGIDNSALIWTFPSKGRVLPLAC